MMDIDRRTILALSGGAILAAGSRAALSQSVGTAPPGRGRRVVVIGAGILGASIAYHIAKSGAHVTVIEKERPTAGATKDAFAWLNAAGKQPKAYGDLNTLGILGWHRLQAEIGVDKLPVQWGGNITWTDDAGRAERIRASILRQRSWGYPVTIIDPREFSLLLPSVHLGPADLISFSGIDGTVEPVQATLALLAAAERHGAVVKFPVAVTGFDVAGERVSKVRTSDGDLEADDVILAAGLGCEPLAAMVGANIPLRSSLGMIAHTVKRPTSLARIAYTPRAHIKQNPGGEFVTYSTLGTPFDAKGSPAEGEALLKVAAEYVPEIRDAKLDRVTLGHRVLPKDGLPIVGALPNVPNLYVAAMHSGMTMGPAIGQLVAVEVLDGAKTVPLEPFRPDRFA